jgi:hypothetical protein
MAIHTGSARWPTKSASLNPVAEEAARGRVRNNNFLVQVAEEQDGTLADAEG